MLCLISKQRLFHKKYSTLAVYLTITPTEVMFHNFIPELPAAHMKVVFQRPIVINITIYNFCNLGLPRRAASRGWMSREYFPPHFPFARRRPRHT